MIPLTRLEQLEREIALLREELAEYRLASAVDRRDDAYLVRLAVLQRTFGLGSGAAHLLATLMDKAPAILRKGFVADNRRPEKRRVEDPDEKIGSVYICHIRAALDDVGIGRSVVVTQWGYGWYLTLQGKTAINSFLAELAP